jgi:hypothetical protein
MVWRIFVEKMLQFFLCVWKFPYFDNGDYCQILDEFLNFYTFG